MSETDRVIGLLDRFTERLITKIVLDVTANLIETTPVDTGWARANWVPNLSRPLIEDLSDVEPSSQAAAAKAAQQGQATATVATGYRLELGPVYISNNVPYIIFLNQGSSPQARPAGFVQRAIAKAVTRDILSIRQ